MKKLIVFICSLFFILLTPPSCSDLSNLNPQDDCGFVLNPFFQRVSLKRKTLVFFIHSSIPEEFQQALQDSIAWWNKALNREILFIRTPSPENINPIAQDGLSVFSIRDTWDPNKPGEQARTSLYWNGDLITEADIIFNAYNFSFYSEEPSETLFNGPRKNKIHFLSLAIHEVGHALGLDHQPRQTSVMYAFLRPRTLRLALDVSTKASLRCEYYEI